MEGGGGALTGPEKQRQAVKGSKWGQVPRLGQSWRCGASHVICSVQVILGACEAFAPHTCPAPGPDWAPCQQLGVHTGAACSARHCDQAFADSCLDVSPVT